ncbi:MAG: hypothetical protein LUD76_07115 [Alistipes sp.]|nr:hypothetical protein [Alistipes sp.]
MLDSYQNIDFISTVFASASCMNIQWPKNIGIIKPSLVLSSQKIRGGVSVPAGYPAEVYNYLEPGLDLNEYLIGKGKRNNRCTWAVHRGMTGEGIDIGDLLVFDISLKPTKDRIGIYWYDDEYTLRRAVRTDNGLELVSPNPEVRPIVFGSEEVAECQGVLTHAVKKYSVYNNNYAGLPEDAGTYLEKGMDYVKYLVNQWQFTFYFWANGVSMTGDNIDTGDLLIVDSLEEPHPDSICMFVVDRQYTLKRIEHHGDKTWLVSSNPAIPPIEIKKGEELGRWGVLTGVIKKY